MTGKLEPGCLVEINSTKRLNGKKTRYIRFALFLGRQPAFVSQSFVGGKEDVTLRFLESDGIRYELQESIFETTAHIYVRVIDVQ